VLKGRGQSWQKGGSLLPRRHRDASSFAGLRVRHGVDIGAHHANLVILLIEIVQENVPK
jgi:hypothetical protein